MSAVASHCHNINRRHVRFPALNWEEEEQRTNRGASIRRERQQRKHEQKMAQQQQETDRRSTFLALQCPANERRILELCNDHLSLRSNVFPFLRATVGNNPGNTPQEQLERFRLHLGLGDHDLYDLMRTDRRYVDSMDLLSLISVESHFKHAFLPENTVVPDSNSDTASSNASANSSEIGIWGPFNSISSYTMGSNDSMIGDGGMQAGGVEGIPVPEVEVRGNHVLNHAVNQPAPVDPSDDGGRQGGGVEEPPVPEEGEVRGHHVGNHVVNQLAPVELPVDAANAAAAAAADSDSRRGIKRSLSPKENRMTTPKPSELTTSL